MSYGYGAYKKTAVSTASKEQILLMLYQAAIKNCKKAIEAIEQKQIAATSAKILEINPENTIIHSLVSKLTHSESAPDIEDAVWMLFDQARILEGETITDPAAFTRRLQRFVEKTLVA